MKEFDLTEIHRKTSSGKKEKKDSDTSGEFWSFLNKDIALFKTTFNDKNKEGFYLELSTLLSSGLDIKSSLDLIEQEQEKVSHRTLISDIKKRLIEGAALWEALKAADEFTAYEYYSIQVGEETGKIVEVLIQLHQFYHAKLKQRRQFISALSYPVIILVTAFGAVSFMLLFIVPMFKDVFKRFGGELPYLTRMIISFSEGLSSNIIWIVLLLTGGAIFIYLKHKEPWFRKASSQFISKIPIIGSIVVAIQLARFCSTMSLLIGSKVALIRALDLVGKMVTFYPIQISIEPLAKNIIEGRSLHESMSSFPIYDRKMMILIKVGEEANKLDVFFEKLAKQYSSDAEHYTSLLNTFLEPAMIIFLGLVVGFILLAMYLPMFELSTSIGR